MHHLPVENNHGDHGSGTKFGFGGNNQLHCPKPRRLGPDIPEFLKPPRCSKHSQSTTDGRSGILNVLADQTSDGREFLCTGGSPFCYSGSPPGRTDNPLVNDVAFIHQTALRLSDKFGPTSGSPI